MSHFESHLGAVTRFSSRSTGRRQRSLVVDQLLLSASSRLHFCQSSNTPRSILDVLFSVLSSADKFLTTTKADKTLHHVSQSRREAELHELTGAEADFGASTAPNEPTVVFRVASTSRSQLGHPMRSRFSASHAFRLRSGCSKLVRMLSNGHNHPLKFAYCKAPEVSAALSYTPA